MTPCNSLCSWRAEHRTTSVMRHRPHLTRKWGAARMDRLDVFFLLVAGAAIVLGIVMVICAKPEWFF